ncbi:hypothetical protein Ancab_019092 [Ancistrocladus abbreviatus]
MSKARVNSSPDLHPGPTTISSQDDSSLEGVATNVRLLLKLLQDHQEASQRGYDERRTQRMTGMMSILDDVKTRIQKSQSSGKRREPELRRCFTDLKVNPVPSDKKKEPLLMDDKERLKRELNTSFAAQKRLGVMCATLGREKEIIARELTRKVQELNEIEELVDGLRAQNEKLSAKVRACAEQHNTVSCVGEVQVNAALQERNKLLSEQVLKSLETFKVFKRKLKEAQDEKAAMIAKMEEFREAAAASLEQIHRLKQHADDRDELPADIKEEIAALENSFTHVVVSKTRQKENDR